MKHFLSVAKGNSVYFYNGWACSSVSGLIVKYNVNTHEFDGKAVDLKELKNAVKILNGYLKLIDDSIYVVSGDKKKKLLTVESSYTEDADITPPTRVPNKFYDRLITASKYISYDKTRYFLNGICLTELGGVWATDGRHMIAYRDDEDLAYGIEAIVSWNTALAKLKIRETFLHDKYMEFVTVKGVHYFSELIVGKFPNCKRLLEDLSGFYSVTLTSDVCTALTFAEKFVDDKHNLVNINNKGIVTLDDSPYSDKWYVEEPFEFTCNLIYLNRCLSDILVANFVSKTSKKMMFRDSTTKIFFEDAEKVTMLMPFVKY